MSVEKVLLFGRTNVGKSTLFNALTHDAKALVLKDPGVTRNSRVGFCELPSGCHFNLVDSGGYTDEEDETSAAVVANSFKEAESARLILFVLDQRYEPTIVDYELTDWLRRNKKNVLVVLNKCDLKKKVDPSEFYQLGFGQPLEISSSHQRGLSGLLEQVENRINELQISTTVQDTSKHKLASSRKQIAIVGRPNVGKSTLFNAILNVEASIVSSIAGTTTDAVRGDLSAESIDWSLIDTAGLRKRGRVSSSLEKQANFQALGEMNRADAVLFLIDATEGLVEQDKRILHQVLKRHISCIILINKIDLLVSENKLSLYDEIERKIKFAKTY